jgi:hypothetical protein
MEGAGFQRPEFFPLDRCQVLPGDPLLQRFRPELTAYPVPHNLVTLPSMEALWEADIIASLVDSDPARLTAAATAAAYLKPHLDIGQSVVVARGRERELGVDVRLIIPGQGCLRCIGGAGELSLAMSMNYLPWLPERDLIAARGSSRVQRVQGAVDEQYRSCLTSVSTCDADARGEGERGAAGNREAMAGNALSEALRQRFGGPGVQARCDQQKVVRVETTDEIIGAYRVTEHGAEVLEHPISPSISVGTVDFSQLVDTEDEAGEGVPVADRALYLLIQPQHPEMRGVSAGQLIQHRGAARQVWSCQDLSHPVQKHLFHRDSPAVVVRTVVS